jgi:hypothetical protein
MRMLKRESGAIDAKSQRGAKQLTIIGMSLAQEGKQLVDIIRMSSQSGSFFGLAGRK